MIFDVVFFFQAEDGIRDLVRSRGLGDVYKRQAHERLIGSPETWERIRKLLSAGLVKEARRANAFLANKERCLLYTSDAADERSSVDLGGRRIIKKKNSKNIMSRNRAMRSKKRE